MLGIERQDVLSFKIYPNPFSDRINLENSRTENLNLTILNSLGQVVRQMKINTNNEIIDLSEQNEGIYLLRISDQKSKMTTKIIKKH